MKRLLAVCLLATLLLPLWAQLQPASPPKVVEVPVYQFADYVDKATLEMPYASARIRDTGAWDGWKDRKISRVDLVFTRYPQELEDWIISYETLLNRRLAALRELRPDLLTDSSIEWNYYLQTDCKTEAAAKALFHGFVLYPAGYDSRMEEVKRIVHQLDAPTDSTAFFVLERHPEWTRKLVVMDWTASMYPYGASVLLWHALHLRDSSIAHFVFFNDGNERPTKQKIPGKTGGIFHSQTNDIDTVLTKMAEVMEKGDGGDSPENDVEALLRGSKSLQGYAEVILIADNSSRIRDLSLAPYLKVPIKIILCGVKEDRPIHADYLNLARRTGGSVHTLEKDLENLVRFQEGQTIQLGKGLYQIQAGKFVAIERS